MTRRMLALTVFVLLLSTAASAQPPTDASEWRPRSGVSRVWGGGYQSLEGPQLSAGIVIGTIPAVRNKCAYGATSSGALVQGHVSLNGAKLSAGAGSFNPLVSYAAKASVLRLWRASGESKSGTTLVGPEVQAGFFAARLTAGLLWPVGGNRNGDRRFSWGVGIGF